MINSVTEIISEKRAPGLQEFIYNIFVFQHARKTIKIKQI